MLAGTAAGIIDGFGQNFNRLAGYRGGWNLRLNDQRRAVARLQRRAERPSRRCLERGHAAVIAGAHPHGEPRPAVHLAGWRIDSLEKHHRRLVGDDGDGPLEDGALIAVAVDGDGTHHHLPLAGQEPWQFQHIGGAAPHGHKIHTHAHPHANFREARQRLQHHPRAGCGDDAVLDAHIHQLGADGIQGEKRAAQRLAGQRVARQIAHPVDRHRIGRVGQQREGRHKGENPRVQAQRSGTGHRPGGSAEGHLGAGLEGLVETQPHRGAGIHLHFAVARRERQQQWRRLVTGRESCHKHRRQRPPNQIPRPAVGGTTKRIDQIRADHHHLIDRQALQGLVGRQAHQAQVTAAGRHHQFEGGRHRRPGTMGGAQQYAAGHDAGRIEGFAEEQLDRGANVHILAGIGRQCRDDMRKILVKRQIPQVHNLVVGDERALGLDDAADQRLVGIQREVANRHQRGGETPAAAAAHVDPARQSRVRRETHQHIGTPDGRAATARTHQAAGDRATGSEHEVLVDSGPIRRDGHIRRGTERLVGGGEAGRPSRNVAESKRARVVRYDCEHFARRRFARRSSGHRRSFRQNRQIHCSTRHRRDRVAGQHPPGHPADAAQHQGGRLGGRRARQGHPPDLVPAGEANLARGGRQLVDSQRQSVETRLTGRVGVDEHLRPFHQSHAHGGQRLRGEAVGPQHRDEQIAQWLQLHVDFITGRGFRQARAGNPLVAGHGIARRELKGPCRGAGEAKAPVGPRGHRAQRHGGIGVLQRHFRAGHKASAVAVDHGAEHLAQGGFHHPHDLLLVDGRKNNLAPAAEPVDRIGGRQAVTAKRHIVEMKPADCIGGAIGQAFERNICKRDPLAAAAHKGAAHAGGGCQRHRHPATPTRSHLQRPAPGDPRAGRRQHGHHGIGTGKQVLQHDVALAIGGAVEAFRRIGTAVHLVRRPGSRRAVRFGDPQFRGAPAQQPHGGAIGLAGHHIHRGLAFAAAHRVDGPHRIPLGRQRNLRVKAPGCIGANDVIVAEADPHLHSGTRRAAIGHEDLAGEPAVGFLHRRKCHHNARGVGIKLGGAARGAQNDRIERRRRLQAPVAHQGLAGKLEGAEGRVGVAFSAQHNDRRAGQARADAREAHHRANRHALAIDGGAGDGACLAKTNVRHHRLPVVAQIHIFREPPVARVELVALAVEQRVVHPGERRKGLPHRRHDFISATIADRIHRRRRVKRLLMRRRRRTQRVGSQPQPAEIIVAIRIRDRPEKTAGHRNRHADHSHRLPRGIQHPPHDPPHRRHPHHYKIFRPRDHIHLPPTLPRKTLRIRLVTRQHRHHRRLPGRHPAQRETPQRVGLDQHLSPTNHRPGHRHPCARLHPPTHPRPRLQHQIHRPHTPRHRIYVPPHPTATPVRR